jgi:hypothetical protein
MLFRETVAVYCENHTEHINTLCGGGIQSKKKKKEKKKKKKKKKLSFQQAVEAHKDVRRRGSNVF